MIDPLLFFGGLLFVILGLLASFFRGRLWNLYKMDRRWHARNPERTPEWDETTRRHGRVYLIVGIGAMILSFVLGQPA